MCRLALALLLAIPVTIGAQALTAARDPVTPLDGPWRFHTGDDPAWAAPAFDDSNWSSMDLKPRPDAIDPFEGTRGFLPGWSARGFPGYSGFAWYRLRVNLQDILPNSELGDGNRLAMLMPESVDDGYQVYIDGHLAGQFGRFTGKGVTTYLSHAVSFPLPAEGVRHPNSTMVIAIRMWMAPSTLLTYPDAGGLHRPPVIGDASTIHDLLLLSQVSLARSLASNIVEIAVLILALLAAFGLYALNRSDPANLWLGFVCLVNLISPILFILAYSTTWFGGTTVLAVEDAIRFPALIGLWVIFWAYWFRLDRISRLQRIVWALVLFLGIGMALLREPFFGHLHSAHAEIWVIPLTAFCKLLLGAILVWVTYRGIRKDRTEGWLALPAVVLVVIALYQGELLILHVITTYFFLFRFAVSLSQIATVLSLAVITLLLLRRFLRAQRQQEQWKMEMEQARQVQSLLIPTSNQSTPGFAVESVYIPASEVGGDFFQVLPGSDGSLLIVVGDVSGKGLKAAMTVSAIVGALRDTRERQPAEVLAHLNRVLCGQISGFVTCCAALIASNGAMAVSNAGHLLPYRNGDELVLANGLPLGIAAGVSYEEAAFELGPNDRLTFLSDGVVEATNPTTKELYGFDRTAGISTQSAENIAATAQQFGQEDDITVLTVTFAPVEVLHA
jgi:hypothetical protein